MQFKKNGNDNPICRREKETQVYRRDFWTLWEKASMGWSERTALKHVYYQVWNRSPAQVGWMRQVLGAGALGRPRGMGWGGRLEGSGWGTHVNPWLIHVNAWQKPLQYCKIVSLQLIKINEKNILDDDDDYYYYGRKSIWSQTLGVSGLLKLKWLISVIKGYKIHKILLNSFEW